MFDFLKKQTPRRVLFAQIDEDNVSEPLGDELKAELNKDGPEGTPLYYAAAKNKATAIKQLIAQGAEVNKKSIQHKYETPLLKACMECHLDAVTALIAGGADVNLYNDGYSAGKNTTSPLEAAEKCKNKGIVELLLEKRAKEVPSKKPGATNGPGTYAHAQTTFNGRPLHGVSPTRSTVPTGGARKNATRKQTAPMDRCVKQYCGKTFLKASEKMARRMAKTLKMPASLMLKSMRSSKTRKKMQEQCKKAHCNPTCKDTLYQAGKALPADIFKSYNGPPKGKAVFTSLMTRIRKDMFGKSNNVLKNGFYQKIPAKNVTRARGQGALSGCTFNIVT